MDVVATTRAVISLCMRPPTLCARHAEVEESVRLVPRFHSCFAQRDVPVSTALGVVLLHAVVGDEYECAIVEYAGVLERSEDLADPTVAVAHRRRRDLRVRPALVHRCV